MAVRDAWLFRGGDGVSYPDRGIPYAGRGWLEQVVNNTHALMATSAVPLDVEHAPSEHVLDIGRVVPGSLRVVTGRPPGTGPEYDGDWIVGQADVDDEIDGRLKARGLSVLYDFARHALTKVALTVRPRVPGAALFAAAFTGAGSTSSAAFFDTGGRIPMRLLSDEDVAAIAAAVRAGDAQPGAQPNPNPNPAQPTNGTQPAQPNPNPAQPVYPFNPAQPVAQPTQPVEPAQPTQPANGAQPNPAQPVNGAPTAQPGAQPLPADPALAAAMSNLQTQFEQERQARLAVEGRIAQAECAAFAEGMKAKGAPPWLVDALAPVAYGQPAQVAFTDAQGQTVNRALDAAGTARYVLEAFAAAPLPQALVMPADDDHAPAAKFSTSVDHELKSLANDAAWAEKGYHEQFAEAVRRTRAKGIRDDA